MTQTVSDKPTSSAERTGIVGSRHLVAVQTFDIARLTTHPIPLVPGTFVAVSGQGPKGDSNGSGKTSFLAAVSLLLGEAQWRLEANGSQFAASLLFKPESAGLDPEHRYAQSERGYVVGVFANPDKPEETALTVWMRIASSTPYIKVRWVHGLHVAIADSDLERDAQADLLWEAMPRTQEIGPKRFATELYGDAPRCMAYLDTPMRPSAPSLLSQQMTEMTPARIGEALIELTGRQGLLETEEEQRNRLAEQKSQLETKKLEDERARVDEQADLDAVHHRNQSRVHLAEGEHMWRLHFARGYLEVSSKDAELAEIIGELEQQVETANEDLETKRAAVEALRAQTDLEEQAREAETQHEQAKDRYEACREKHAEVSRKLREFADRRAELLPLRDGWTGLTVEAAKAELDAGQALWHEAKLDRGEAEREHATAKKALEEVRAGGGGPAGAALALLKSRIPAVALLDEITLAPHARAAWEPRLWPHRHAVVVSPGHEAEALTYLAEAPGATVVVADGPLDGARSEPYDGVVARVPISRFLAELESRTDVRSAPDRAIDARLGETVVGGFPQEIAGRAARIAAAEAEMTAASELLEEMRTAERAADLIVESATEALVAAEAVSELEHIATAEQALHGELGELAEDLAGLHIKAQEAETKRIDAAAAVKNHQTLVELAVRAAREMEQRLTTMREGVKQRSQDRDRLNLAYWIAGWGDTHDAARGLLDAEPEHIASLRPRSLRHRAAEKLKDALDAYLGTAAEIPPELAQARERRQRLADGEPGVGGWDSDFTSIAQPLRDLLDSRQESDQILEARITRSQHDRATQIQAMQTETDQLDAEMGRLQDAISSRIEASLDKISKALDRLNRARGGFGAELRIAETRASSATTAWKWEVSPRWRRSPSGGMVSYREVANGAQVKVFAIQLVLAALLAAEGAQGRVLVLDELGNSLGDVNRKDVLRDLNEVANQQQVTILGTCQDSVIGDAAGVCGEILWFCHQAHTEAYNQPTRVWGYDANGERVELVRAWLTAGRGLV